ncbi:hypothetical protein ABC502_05500 [Alkalimonas sp. NCh-2]|uniref:hypothetical protein n=1 Tax=Alkalimonas sp. NCh-2 TaxID=3144846 RepID=UPI0031F67526
MDWTNINTADERWDSWFDDEGVSDDFMPNREQPEHQAVRTGTRHSPDQLGGHLNSQS